MGTIPKCINFQLDLGGTLPNGNWVPNDLGWRENLEFNTLPETNMAPENGWLEDEFPFGKAYFQGLC